MEEKELLFENVTQMNKTIYLEGVKASAGKMKTVVFPFLGAVITVIGLMTSNIVVAFFGILIFVLSTLSHLIIGVHDFHKLEMIHPTGEWEKRFRFYEDHFETGSGDQTCLRHYEQIRSTVGKNGVYVISFGKEAPATMLAVDGFTKGTVEQLDAFLTEKQRGKYTSEFDGKGHFSKADA